MEGPTAGLPFADNREFVLRGMMWADNYWLFCDKRDRLICMVNDIEELLDLDVEPKPESPWWTSTHKHEDMTTRRVGRGRAWELPFREVFDVLGSRCHRDGKGFQGAERTTCKGMGSWWRDEHIYRSKTVSMAAKCKRVQSHEHSTVLKGSINWPWSGAKINKSSCLGSEDTTSHLQASHEAGRNVGGLQNEDMKKLNEKVGGKWACRC